MTRMNKWAEYRACIEAEAKDVEQIVEANKKEFELSEQSLNFFGDLFAYPLRLLDEMCEEVKK